MPTPSQRVRAVTADPPLPAPVPTLGAELLVNGGMEGIYVGGVAPGWGKLGTPTVAESADAYAGSAAQSVADSGNNSNNSVRQSLTVAAGSWALVSAYGKKGTGTGGLRAYYGGPAPYVNWTAEAWTRALLVYVIGNPTLYFYTTGIAPCLFDEVSFKVITPASMFSARAYSTHATTKAAVTVVAGTRAGVVCNLDSATAPANYIVASHDGTTARLEKFVAGTYTSLISTAATYVAGAFVEIRRAAGSNDYDLYYNGSKVGTTQTISDAGITGNILHGYFNTYAGNQLAEFSCAPS